MTTAAKHYQTLNVRADATQAEIKAAYRRLAREHHPDVNDSADAETRMQEINEAYRVLGDIELRQKYDESGDSRGADVMAERARNVLLGLFAEALQADSKRPLASVRQRIALRRKEMLATREGVVRATDQVKRKLQVVKTPDGVFNAYNHLIGLELERAAGIIATIDSQLAELELAALELDRTYSSTEPPEAKFSSGFDSYYGHTEARLEEFYRGRGGA